MKITFQGIEEVQKMLNELDKLKDKRKVITRAFRKASKPIISILRSTAPYRTGVLKNSMGYKNGKHLSGSVGALVKRGGNHGHLLDLGTKMRKTKKGYNRGKVRATYFFTNAWVTNKDNIADTVQDEVVLLVENIIKGCV